MEAKFDIVNLMSSCPNNLGLSRVQVLTGTKLKSVGTGRAGPPCGTKPHIDPLWVRGCVAVELLSLRASQERKGNASFALSDDRQH